MPAALDGSLAAAPCPACNSANCERGEHEAHGGHLLRPKADAAAEHFQRVRPQGVPAQ